VVQGWQGLVTTGALAQRGEGRGKREDVLAFVWFSPVFLPVGGSPWWWSLNQPGTFGRLFFNFGVVLEGLAWVMSARREQYIDSRGVGPQSGCASISCSGCGMCSGVLGASFRVCKSS